jgi:probable rRNA maturation factor
MPLEIIIGNHQTLIAIPEAWLTALEEAAPQAAALALDHRADPDPPLAHLGAIEVALVDDATIDQVHRDFMDIEGATDVITFHHGEIVISAETAFRQAAEYHEPPAREILRYLVHGLLHLAGHDDANDAARAAMEDAQEAIVRQIWADGFSTRTA